MATPGPHSRVFFDITIGGAATGRVEIELYDNTPITSGHSGPLPQFRSVISIPPARHRLGQRLTPARAARCRLGAAVMSRGSLTLAGADKMAPPVEQA